MFNRSQLEAAAYFFERVHGRTLSASEQELLTECGLEGSDPERLADAICGFLNSSVPISSDLRGLAYFTLGKAHSPRLLNFLRRRLGWEMERDMGVAFQIMIALDNLNESVWQSGPRSFSIDEKQRNRKEALRYLDECAAESRRRRAQMPDVFERLLAEFAALCPEDFYNETAGVCKLYQLTDELMSLPKPERAIPTLFDVMERMPNTDMGARGPLVHTLESMQGHYEEELAQSLQRQPHYLSIGMVNAILNGIVHGSRDPLEREKYMSLLRMVAEHPKASESVREQAKDFIEYQSGGE